MADEFDAHNYKKREKIINDHPNLYPNCLYFECYDGWLDIISDLSDKLEEEIVQFKANCPNLEEGYPHAVQVKEKYGRLQFYLSYLPTNEMHDIIEEFCAKTAKICEICGQNGQLRHDSWVKVRCDEHY